MYDINSLFGNRTYEKGLTFLFKVCATEVLGNERIVRIRHSIDRGIFFEVNKGIEKEQVSEIKKLPSVENIIVDCQFELNKRQAIIILKSYIDHVNKLANHELADAIRVYARKMYESVSYYEFKIHACMNELELMRVYDEAERVLSRHLTIVYNAFVTKYSAPDMNSTANEVAIATMEVAYEELTLPMGTSAPGGSAGA